MQSKTLLQKLLLLTTFCTVFSVQLKGQQNISLPAVSGDLTFKPGTISDSMPFDKPFRLNLKVTSDVVAGTFEYHLKSDSPDALLLKKFNSNTDQAEASNNIFSVECKGLNPNRKYEFDFTLYKKIPDDTKTTLKSAIAKELKRYVDAGQFDVNSFTTFKTNVKKIVCDQLKTTNLASTANGHAVVKIDDFLSNNADISAQIAKLENIRANMADNGTNFFAQANAIADGMGKPGVRALVAALKDDHLLTPASRILYHKSISTNTRFSNVDMSVADLYFSNILNTPATLKDLLAGNVSFDNGYFSKNAKPLTFDEDFIGLLNTFLKVSKEFQWLQDLNYNNTDVTNAIDQLNKVIADYDQHNAYSKSSELTTVVSQFPDLFVNILVVNTLTIETGVKVDVMVNSAPYISLDAGAGYNHAFSTFYTNYGVNIYFVPVDKTIKLRTYNENMLLHFLQVTSFDFGIINNYFNTYNVSKRYIALLGGSKDLFTGLGFRVNRMLKINTGLDWYDLSDINPVSTDKSLHAKWVVGAALDINIVKAFGGVGTAFGF